MIQGFAVQASNFVTKSTKVNLRNNQANNKNNFNDILDNKSNNINVTSDKNKLQNKNDEIIRQQNAQANNRRVDVKNEKVEEKPKEQAKESDIKQEEVTVSKKEKTIEELIENLSQLLVVFQNVVGINVDELEEMNLGELNLEISLEELENLKCSLEEMVDTFNLGDSDQEVQNLIANLGEMIQEVNENGEMEIVAEEFIGQLKEAMDLVSSKLSTQTNTNDQLNKEVEKPSVQLESLMKIIESSKESSKEKSTNLETPKEQISDNKDIKIKIVSEKEDGKNLFNLLEDLEETIIIENIDSATEQMPINILSNNTQQVRPEDLGKVVDTALKPEQFMDIDKSDVLKQITGKMKTDYDGKIDEIKITLTPEHLGALTIRVSLERGILSARAFVENGNVKQLLESNIDELKNSLKEQGVDFASLDVSVGSDSNSEERNSNFFMNHKRVKGLKTNIEKTVDMSQYEELNEHNQSSSMEVGEGGMDITV